MDIIENDENKEILESEDLLKLNINYDEENYLLKIFPSKDNISIIFKLEKENIQTYYYYAKLYFENFLGINKKFSFDKNIFNVYIRLKELCQNYECFLDKKQLKVLITFKKQNSEFSPTFILRKKIVSQCRLNYHLVQQIQENKAKIKLLKKQISKLDKIIQNKNDLIDNINNNIDKITNVVNNINKNTNTIENNEQDNNSNKENNKSSDNNSSSNNNDQSPSIKEEENEDIFVYKSNEQENMLLKKNLSLIKEEYKQTEQEHENKRYISNNRKKQNKYKIKHFKFLFKAEENQQKIEPPQEETLFCFENVEVFKNKKIYETLILFNIITILIIIYLLCSIFSLKSNLTFEKIKDQELMKKFAFLSFLEDNEEDDMEGMRENIVDFQLKHNFDDNINNTNKKMKYSFPRKKKCIEKKEISLLNEEREKRFYKKHIRRRIGHKVKEINLILMYNSKEKYKYRNFYNHFTDIGEILILIKIKNGKKFGVFSNNIFSKEQEPDNDFNNYIGYVYNNEQIIEMDLQIFFSDYGKYIQNIYDFLNNENIRIQSRINNLSNKLLEDIELFEVYQIKY